MPRAKAKATPRQAKKDVEWGGFIDFRINETEKAQFEAWADPPQWTYLDDILADEIKLGLTFDPGTDSFLATLTSEKHAGDGLRCVLTARAGTWDRAILLAIYKHAVLLDSDWGNFLPKTGRNREV